MVRRLVTLGAAGVALPARFAYADDGPTDAPAADAPPPDVPTADPVPDIPAAAQAVLTPLEVQMLALINGARTARGRPPLQWDAVMTAVAREHAADMMSHGFVSHAGSDGSSPQQRLRRAGIKFQFGSENIWTYWGKDPALGPSTMHAAMMSEPFAPGLWNHIGNILYTGYARIGVGIVVAPGGVQYLSETFAD
jgi:uncharacterized protein YkwD